MEKTLDSEEEVNAALEENWHENIRYLEDLLSKHSEVIDQYTGDSIMYVLEYMKDNKENILDWQGFPPQTLDDSIVVIIQWALDVGNSPTITHGNGCKFCNLE